MSQTLQTTGRIRRVEPAPVDAAVAHFAHRLTVETDCSDVHHDLGLGDQRIVVIDARSPEAFAAGHVPGAVNLPFTRRSTAASAAAVIAEGTIAVTYCAGPHCNASTLAALRLAQLGYPVKEMLGGSTTGVRDGYPVTADPA